ncbi:hypothetical protein [Paenibacillus tuaregi]|uniref:hypothetical protein n=1 Tax=Paenibacillus tuaregi TaxID=1816681 RepID=UPI00083859FB|nr:hypothetical protein [Paenibacillus tuaregi]
MNFQFLFNEYLNQKFNRGLPSIQTDSFEYAPLEEGGAELLLAGHENEWFVEWADELQPRDPNYTPNPDWKPVLSEVFEHLDVYDELILYYLLFTINSTTSVVKINAYNAMNDFMKHYCFFQLAQLTDTTRLGKEQKHQLRDFFFFFYLYAHPVNEETLYSFSFRGQELVHTKTGINIEHYFTTFHNYYSQNHDKYRSELCIAPHEIQNCRNLTMELLRTIEGKSVRLVMPPEEGLEDMLRLINNADDLIQMYSEKKTALFGIMGEFLASPHSNPYRDHIFSTLLQNYVTYILYFKFDEIHDLVDYFKSTPSRCRIILNKIFADTIFIQKILRQNHIDITGYPDIIEFFDEEAQRIYL